MYFEYLVGSTVEAMLEQKDSFCLVRKEEHGAIHTRDRYTWSRLENFVVRWASIVGGIEVWVGVEDPGSRTNNGFYEGNTVILFQVHLWIWKLLAQTARVVQLDGHDGSNLE